MSSQPNPSPTYTLLTAEDLCKRLPYDIRTVRERLKSKDGFFRPGRHYTNRSGGRRIFFIWETICADLGLPDANFGPGDLLNTAEAASLLHVHERTLRDTLTKNGTVSQGLHFFVFPGARTLIFSRRALSDLIPVNPGHVEFLPPPNSPTAPPPPEPYRSSPGSGELLLGTIAVHPFSVVAERWAEETSASMTARSRTMLLEILRSSILTRFGDTRIVDVTRQQVIDCLYEVNQTNGHPTAKLAFKLLGDIFAYASRVYGWPSPIASLNELPSFGRIPKVFSVPQCIKLAELCPDPFKTYLVVRLLTGLRNEEVHSLRHSAVSITAGTITLEEILVQGEWVHLDEFRGRRVIPLSSLARRALSRHRALSSPDDSPNGLVFHDNGRPLNAQLITTRLWDPLLRLAGLPPMQLREIRNTAAYLWLSSGEDPRDVAQWYGYGTDVQRLLSRFGSVARIDPGVSSLDRLFSACIGPAESAESRMLGLL